MQQSGNLSLICGQRCDEIVKRPSAEPCLLLLWRPQCGCRCWERGREGKGREGVCTCVEGREVWMLGVRVYMCDG